VHWRCRPARFDSVLAPHLAQCGIERCHNAIPRAEARTAASYERDRLVVIIQPVVCFRAVYVLRIKGGVRYLSRYRWN